MYNLVELFSGIGSQAKAMNNIDLQNYSASSSNDAGISYARTPIK